MTTHEQRMCESQASFFEMSYDAFNCGSPLFISRFMNSDVAKQLDNVDDCYNFISPNNLITIMAMQFDSLSSTKGSKYPKKVLHWIGYTYRAWSLLKHKKSSSIYKDCPAEKLLSLYEVFHTFSIEYCIDRLEEIINQNKPQYDDYTIFRKVMLEQN